MNNDVPGIASLSSGHSTVFPWLNALVERVQGGESLVALLPVRGGHGWASLLAANAVEGSALVVCPDEQTRTHRLALAESLGLTAAVWQSGEENTGVLLLALASDSTDSAEAWAAALQTGPALLVYDLCAPQSKAPTGWEHKSAETATLLLPSGEHPKAWWKQEESDLSVWEHDLETWSWKWGETADTLQGTLEALEDGALVVGSGHILESIEVPERLQTLVLEKSPEVPPVSRQTLFVGSPKSFHNLAPFVRSTGEQLFFHWEEEEQAPLSQGVDLTERLSEWLFARADEAKTALLYENSQNLLEALKLPTAPERAFERSLEQLQQALEHLKQQGVLHSWREVFFQSKIHNTRRFKQAFLMDHPHLLQFWRDYEAMKETLGMQESLKLTFFDGREVDLLPLASRMSYSLGQLNELFRELDEKELLVNRLQNQAHSHRHEFELHLSPAGKTSRAFQLWLQSGDLRKALLRSALSRRSLPETGDLRRLWSRKKPKASHWLEAWQLLNSIEGEAARLAAAGRLLQWQEEEERDGGWMLWVLWAQALSLPQLNTSELLQLLPSLEDAVAELEAPLKTLLSDIPSDTEGFQGVLESLPSTFSFDWLSVESLESLATSAREQLSWDKAYKLGTQLVEQLPERGEVLRTLAECSVQLGKRLEVLQWSLQANRVDPNRYPIQPYLDEIREHLFADLGALREALIELPAHPAFSKLEEELTAREGLERELRPVLKEVEELVAGDKWKEAKAKVSEVLTKHSEHAPFRFFHIQAQIEDKEKELLKALEQKPGRDRRSFNATMEETSKEAQRLGFDDVARQALEHLIKHNPNYGLGYIKLARLTMDQNARDRAFRKAIQLSKNPQQRLRNIEEYGDILVKENNLDSLVPLLLSLMDEEPGQAPQLEPFLLRIIDKSAKQDKIARQINNLVERNNGRIRLPRVEKALKKFEDLDPWKRALLNIKAQR